MYPQKDIELIEAESEIPKQVTRLLHWCFLLDGNA